ncbi:hypothetical protein ACFFMN_06480 [Planobispora siamensis]|uniref:hypothetical protein n=1 Tax=Planobispora siamensis TaxID=936338 RepID=UPI001951F6B8|nr:hypothetical protein [Planobispora siamensis]
MGTPWLAAGPVLLALAIVQPWHLSHSARREIIAAVVLVILSAVAEQDSGAPWAQPILRLAVLALMLFVPRPLDPPRELDAGQGRTHP